MNRVSTLAAVLLPICGLVFSVASATPFASDDACTCTATEGPSNPPDGAGSGGASHVASSTLTITVDNHGNESNTSMPNENCPTQRQKCKWEVKASITCVAGETATARLEAGGGIKSFSVLTPGGTNSGTLNVSAACGENKDAQLYAKNTNPSETEWTWLTGKILYCASGDGGGSQ